MRKLLFILVNLCVICRLGFGQLNVRYKVCSNCSSTEGTDNIGNYNYGTTQNFITKDITSDFGARIPSSYDWHKGVDLRRFAYFGLSKDKGRGDALLSIEESTVIFIRGNASYKYIVTDGINNFGYGHLFNSRPPNSLTGIVSGELVLKETEDFADTYAIINTSTKTAICEEDSAMIIIKINNLNDTIYASNQLTSSTAIGAQGGSGGRNNFKNNANDPFDVHLHLYRYKIPRSNNPNAFDNTLDPLQVINYNIPKYKLSLNSEGENSGQIILDYPQNKEQGFALGCLMQTANGGNVPNGSRFDVGMNISKVEFLIKEKVQSIYSKIKGPTLEAEINLGAISGSKAKPKSIWNDKHLGGYSTTGIYPNAYGGGTPTDTFYYADFSSRISKFDKLGGTKDYTNCPQNTRYNDGQYQIKAKVTDVRGTVTESTSIDLIIDNFQPFIEQVQVFIGTSKVYDMAWACDENCQGMKAEGGVTTELLPNFDDNQQLNIIVKTSEPLNNLEAKLNIGNSTITLTEQIPPLLNNKQNYNYVGTIQDGNILVGLQAFSLEFEGEDFPAPNNPANQLLDLSSFFNPNEPNTNNCLQIPKRIGNMTGNWDVTNIPTGIDKTHTFILSGLCTDEDGLIANTAGRSMEGECPIFANFTHAPDPSDPCTVRFTDQSIGDIIGYQWEFGDGATSTSASPSHAYTSEGHYPVTLTISDGAEEMVISDIVAVYCGGSPGGGGITPGIISECLIQGPQSIKPGEPFTLSVTAYEGSPPFEFEWIVPSFVTPAYVEGPGPHTFVIDEFFARNGEKYTFNVSAIDRAGDDEPCQHDVVIRGNIPGVELTIAQDPSTEFIAFATFVEFWNITGHETYRFFIDGIEVTSCYPYSGTCVDVPYPECGPHEFCVVVTDDVGQYEDCTTVWVGTINLF